MAKPTYDQFVGTEAQEVWDRYVETHRRPPSAPDLYHNAWRRLEEDWTHQDILNDIGPPPPGSPPPSPEPPDPMPPNEGLIRAIDKSFANDQGEFLSLGTTLFWAWWGEKHDPSRLDENLAYLRGFDFVRIFSMVGGPSWADRTIDPSDPDYWHIMARLMARLNRHGLRAQVTIFAAAQEMMPSQSDRRQWTAQWATFAAVHARTIHGFEIANEYYQNGLTAEQVRELAIQLSRATPLLVAASAPPGAYPEDVTGPNDEETVEAWETLYGSGSCDMVTAHFDRDINKAEGAWRPVRQPWEKNFTPDVPTLWINNEPIGPESSVEQDDDPHRIIAAAVASWISGCGAYCLHTGAGVRGGGAADLARGRSVNIWEVNNIHQIRQGLLAMKSLLPPNLSGWAIQNHHWVGHPMHNSFDGHLWPEDDDVDDGVVRAFAAVWGDQYVCLPMGIKGRFDVTVRSDMRLPVCYDLLTGLPTMSTSRTITLTDATPALVVMSMGT